MVKKHRKIIYSGIIVMLMLLLYFLIILFLPMNGDNIDLGNSRYYIAHVGGRFLVKSIQIPEKH